MPRIALGGVPGAITLRGDIPGTVWPITFRAKPQHQVGLAHRALRPFDPDCLDRVTTIFAQPRRIEEAKRDPGERDRVGQDVTRGPRNGCDNGGIAFNQSIE